MRLIITADKYLERELSSKAELRLRESAMKEEDADTVFDIMQKLKSEMHHSETMLEFSEELRKKKLEKLLKNDRYREWLLSDRDRILSQLDELEVPKALVEKQYSSCGPHASSFFQAYNEDPTACFLCWHRRGNEQPWEGYI